MPSRTRLTEAEAADVGSVFEQHQDYIAAVVRRHVANLDDVADVVQTVGIAICRNLHTFTGEAKLRTWLHRVAVNTARTYYRTDSRLTRVRDRVELLGVPEPIVDPDAGLRLAEQRAAVRDALRRLNPLRRRAVLSKFTGSSVQDVSKTTRVVATHELRVRLTNDARFERPIANNGDPERGNKSESGRTGSHGGSDVAERRTGINGGGPDRVAGSGGGAENGYRKGRRRLRS